MLPSKEKNIYPTTKKNVNALFNHYFKIPFGDIHWIYNIEELKLNQIEFIAKKVSENIELLIKEVGGSNDMTVSNAMRYGADVFYLDLENVKQTNRVRITKVLKQSIIVKN